jgi:hypothetical protein
MERTTNEYEYTRMFSSSAFDMIAKKTIYLDNASTTFPKPERGIRVKRNQGQTRK